MTVTGTNQTFAGIKYLLRFYNLWWPVTFSDYWRNTNAILYLKVVPHLHWEASWLEKKKEKKKGVVSFIFLHQSMSYVYVLRVCINYFCLPYNYEIVKFSSLCFNMLITHIISQAHYWAMDFRINSDLFLMNILKIMSLFWGI